MTHAERMQKGPPAPEQTLAKSKIVERSQGVSSLIVDVVSSQLAFRTGKKEDGARQVQLSSAASFYLRCQSVRPSRCCRRFRADCLGSALLLMFQDAFS